MGNSSNTKEMNEIKQTSLKEAAEEYAYRGIPDEIKQNVKPIADEIIKQFIAGAEWQREKMLKDAVEGVVMNFSSNTPRPQIDVFVDPHKYCSGDKVKIVIIKGND